MKYFALFSKYSAIAVALTGLCVLAGWLFDIPFLKSIHPDLVTMKVNTALSFLLMGSSLWLLREGSTTRLERYVARTLVIIVLFVGGLTLAEYIFSADIGIDQLVFKDDPNPALTSNPGRMAPLTAFNFIVASLSILLIDTKTRKGRCPSQYLACILGLISLFVAVGYLYQVAVFFKFSSYTGMAIHTSAAFLLLFLGIFFARPDTGLAGLITCNDAGGIVVRQMLPVAVISVVILGWLRVYGEKIGLYGTETGVALFVLVVVVVASLQIFYTATVIHGIDLRRKELFDELSESHSFSQALVRTIPFGMEIVGGDGTLLYINDRLKEVYGEGAVGKKCWMLCKDDKKQCAHCPLLEDIPAGETRTVETAGMLGGRTFAVSHTVMIYRGKRAVLEVFMDVTDRVELEKLRDNVTAMLTHDLKNPLAQMMLAAELLHDEIVGPLNEKQKETVQAISGGGRRLHHLIMDILDTRKLRENKFVPQTDTFDAEELLGDISWMFALSEKENKKIIVDIDKDLKIIADRKVIARILVNLVSNGIEHGGNIISVRLKKMENRAYLEVSDDGQGIPKEYIGSIFDRYFSLDKGDGHADGGTGLGLTFCKLALTAQGSQIHVESATGKGAKFYFHLPIAC